MRYALAIAAVACAACGAYGDGPRLVERAAVAMGSELRVGIWTGDAAGAGEAIAVVFAEFERLEALMSVWRDGSDIVRLNEAAGRHAVVVSDDVAAVLQAAREVSVWSDGAFDVTFGALSDVWRFDHDQDNRIPAASAVAARLPLVDYRQLELRGREARLARAGMRAHLGGIGKGYALDRAAALLRQRGFDDFLLQSGGDMYAGGLRDGRPWRIGIRDPRGPADRSFAALDLSDGAISTSGDYERFFEQDGRRYHHILDPRTGEPAAGSRSVTVVADRAVTADALSTAVFVLGPQAGLALLERVPQAAGVIVSDANEVIVSAGLAGRVTLLQRPSDGR